MSMLDPLAAVLDQALRAAVEPPVVQRLQVSGKVSGSRLCAYVDALPENKAYRAKIITEAAGIQFIIPNEWYPVQVEVDALLHFERELGAFTLEALGHGVVDRTAPMFPDLAHALEGLNPWYQAAYDGEGHGMFEVLELKLVGRRALVRSTTKNSDAFDLGVITAFLKRHKRAAHMRISIYPDARKPARSRGYSNTTYVVMW